MIFCCFHLILQPFPCFPLCFGHIRAFSCGCGCSSGFCGTLRDFHCLCCFSGNYPTFPCSYRLLSSFTRFCLLIRYFSVKSGDNRLFDAFSASLPRFTLKLPFTACFLHFYHLAKDLSRYPALSLCLLPFACFFSYMLFSKIF